MKKSKLFAVMMMAVLSAKAQLSVKGDGDVFTKRGYWINSSFVKLEPSKSSRYYIQLTNDSLYEQQKGYIRSTFKQVEELPSKGFVVESETPPMSNEWFVSKAYKSSSSDESFVRPRIAVSIKEGFSTDCLLAKYNHVLQTNRVNGRVTLYDCALPTSDEILDLAMQLYEEPEVEWSEPMVSGKIELCNTKYSQQYYLKNTGQGGGIAGIDINVEPAWNITSGSPNITVAVLDEGVDFSHEDMGNAVISGYTLGSTTEFGTPTASDCAHGMACAGIIAAQDNTIGIKGIAYGVNILPVNIFPGSMSFPDDIASAIQWAYPRADVLSCSWHSFESPYLTNSINDALTYGRTGKGTVVVFAAGNDWSNTISYPASLDGTIAVGAIDKWGDVWYYSNTGEHLDLVAPSGETGLDGDIVTTDRMGILGYTTSGDWNYTEYFGGTSAACPQVAGVAALMLSVNPNLTQSEVRNILTSTARKLPDYTYTSGWNNEIGYGLVDAGAAVYNAMNLSLTGPTIPQASSVYSINNLPSGFTVSWAWKNGSTHPIISGTPSANSCTIHNINKSYINDVLVATVSKGGNVITTFEKQVYTGVNFTGTYKQAGGSVNPPLGSGLPTYYAPIPETTFADNATILIHREHKVTLKSSLFSTSTISVSGPTPSLSLTQNGDSITFFAPTTTQGAVYTFTGKNTAGYDVYRFTVTKLKDSLVPVFLGLTHTNGILSLYFKNETDEVIDARDLQDFDIDIIVANVQTGKIVYRSTQTGAATDISTKDWKTGIYCVQATIAGEQLSNKIIINK